MMKNKIMIQKLIVKMNKLIKNKFNRYWKNKTTKKKVTKTVKTSKIVT